jgi:hypothetical protein
MQNILPTVALYFTFVVGMIVTGATIVGGIAFWRTEKDSGKTFSLLIQRFGANFIQMLAVVLIILAACALRIMDKVSAEAVVSILSGVAGYVLGGSTRTRQGVEESNST